MVERTKDDADYRTSHRGAHKSEDYDRGFWEPGTTKHLFWQIEERMLRDVLTERAPASALDFACGTGRVLSVLEKEVGDVIGIDISPEMAELARRRCTTAEIIVGDLTRDSTLIDQRFDLITAFRFFLNAQDELRRSALTALSRQLSPNGALVANFHLNPYSIGGAHARLAGLVRRKSKNMLSLREVRELLFRAGFRIQRCSGYGYTVGRVDQLRFPRLQTVIESTLARAPVPPAIAQAFFVVATPL